MTDDTQTTTAATYDADLATAAAMLTERVPDAGFPEGERDKALADALNRTWTDGIMLGTWVDSAAALLAD